MSIFAWWIILYDDNTNVCEYVEIWFEIYSIHFFYFMQDLNLVTVVMCLYKFKTNNIMYSQYVKNINIYQNAYYFTLFIFLYVI